MHDLFLLSEARMRRIEPYFPLSHDIPRVDDRGIFSVQPVLRRSPPSSPSRNKPAEAATRSWVNNGAIRALTARSDNAQSSSVSIEIPVIHDLRIMVTDGFRRSKKAQL